MRALGNENEVSVDIFSSFTQTVGWFGLLSTSINLCNGFFWGETEAKHKNLEFNCGKSLICSDSAKVSPNNARRALLADDKTFR